MKQLFCLCLWVLMGHVTKSQDISVMFTEANRLENLPNEGAALSKIKEILKLSPIHLEALSKASELCVRIGKRQTDEKKMNDYYQAARTYANIALQIDSNHSMANCALAMTLGCISLTKSGKAKIAASKEIKWYTDKAIKNNPGNYKAWHVLGRWNYEIANLNFVERAAVKILYGGLPPASVDQAIIAFEKAHALSNGFVQNYFELARAYYKKGRKAKAIQWMKLMQQLPNHTEEDASIKLQGAALLNDWE